MGMTKTLTYPFELVKQLNARHDELVERLTHPDLDLDERLATIEEQEEILKLLARIGHVTMAWTNGILDSRAVSDTPAILGASMPQVSSQLT